jgi:S1-C subfamily serine protease
MLLRSLSAATWIRPPAGPDVSEDRPRAGRAVHWGLLVCLVLPALQVHAAERIQRLFERVDPAVVVLRTLGRDVTAAGGGIREVASAGIGSGVLVDGEGHVVTAAHVVHTADRVVAEFLDGRRLEARVVSSNPELDLALLRLEDVPLDVDPVELGDSSAVRVGQQVFVVGAPYGIGHSLSVGYISGRRAMQPGAPEHLHGVSGEMFQTDAAINQGNSGGPVFDLDGRVIGIVSNILTRSGGFDGIGFAVTSDTVREALFENPMFWSGLEGVFVQGALADALNLGYDSGFLVQKVAEGSVSDRLGLRPGRLPITLGGRTIQLGGDVIVSMDGIRLTEDSAERIREHMDAMTEGDRVTLRVLRAGNFVDLTATLE